jgi:hypothetical protein
MFRQLALGFIAAAALSASSLAPSAASAKGWGHHHHHHHGHHHHWSGPRFVIGGGYGGCYVKRLVQTRHGLRYRVVNVCY